MYDKKVLIIGAGPAGLSSAIELAKQNIDSVIIEKSLFPGGHGIDLACKAAEKCVKCGACIVEEKIREASKNPGIKIISGARAKIISNPDDPGSDGFAAIIEKEAEESECSVSADAVILATGFRPFDPENKPYGYKKFQNVITSLELEKMIREKGMAQTRSDGKAPDSIAFIQCVGSRDSSLGHLWCSKVCCGSALRMACLAKTDRPETEIVFFYIDIQNFGKDFIRYHEKIKNEIELIRSIPGDIFETQDNKLSVGYFDKATESPCEKIFDMVVLSVGITPENPEILQTLAKRPENSKSFISTAEQNEMAKRGVFVAGTAKGPMNIEESVADGGFAALNAIKYMEKKTCHE